MTVNPLHAETRMSLPDVRFQKGPIPNVEFAVYAKCLEKELQYCGAHKTCSKQSSLTGSPGTVFVKLLHGWRNGIIISYEVNCSVKCVLHLHVAWRL